MEQHSQRVFLVTSLSAFILFIFILLPAPASFSGLFADGSLQFCCLSARLRSESIQVSDVGALMKVVQ